MTTPKTKKYDVRYWFHGEGSVTVEAENAKEARGKALDEMNARKDELHPSGVHVYSDAKIHKE
ncbi:MAG: hypothetical protein QMC36_06385 [Patescibacteria group bacterium]